MRGSRFAPPCAADVAEYLTNDSDVDQGSGSDGEEPCPAQTQTQTRATAMPIPIPVAAAPASKNMTLLRAGDPALNPDNPKKCAPVVTKYGLRAYEIRYPAGQRGASNMNCLFAPRGFFPAEQVRLRFKIMPERGFPWGGGRQKAGGKILGFKMGKGDSQGGSYSPTGASYRITWSYTGGVGPYVYPAIRGGGQPRNLQALDERPEFNAVASLSKGVHLWHPRDRENPGAWDLRLRDGQWNTVEMFVRMNTPGKYDGVLEMTVNGVRKSITTMRWRYDAMKINGVLVHSFFGGGDLSYAPPRPTKLWLADFEFGTA